MSRDTMPKQPCPTVRPDGILSLQKHCHRAEHWVVVRRTAEVTHNDQTNLVPETESIYPTAADIGPANLSCDIWETTCGLKALQYLDIGMADRGVSVERRDMDHAGLDAGPIRVEK